MGPALQLLYQSLTQRSTELTPYEAQLHQELHNSMELTRRKKPVGGKDLPIKTRKAGLVGALTEKNTLRVGHTEPDFIGRLDTHVDLGPGGTVPPLQISCGYDKCPNKKRR